MDVVVGLVRRLVRVVAKTRGEYWVNYKKQVIIFSLMNVKVEVKTK